MRRIRKDSDRQAALVELLVSRRNDITEMNLPASRTDEGTEWFSTRTTCAAKGTVVQRQNPGGHEVGAHNITLEMQHEMTVGIETGTDMMGEIGGNGTTTEAEVGIVAEGQTEMDDERAEEIPIVHQGGIETDERAAQPPSQVELRNVLYNILPHHVIHYFFLRATYAAA
jgi:hypothetical protein